MGGADRRARGGPLRQHHPEDDRITSAVGAAGEFARGGQRSQRQRTTSFAALKAAAESAEPSAEAAARAACATASLAYLHPDLVDPAQLKHLYWPVVYSATALELDDDDEAIGDAAVRHSLGAAHEGVKELVRSIPSFRPGRTRAATLSARLDRALRQ